MPAPSARLAAVLLVAGAFGVGSAAPALAVVCDAYSRTCPSTPPGVVGGVTDGAAQGPTGVVPGAAVGGAPVSGNTGGPAAGNTGGPTALPFTGAELVLATAAGLAAVAGGTALTVVGRRRRVGV